MFFEENCLDAFGQKVVLGEKNYDWVLKLWFDDCTNTVTDMFGIHRFFTQNLLLASKKSCSQLLQGTKWLLVCSSQRQLFGCTDLSNFGPRKIGNTLMQAEQAAESIIDILNML